jgi:hypothetical protein
MVFWHIYLDVPTRNEKGKPLIIQIREVGQYGLSHLLIITFFFPIISWNIVLFIHDTWSFSLLQGHFKKIVNYTISKSCIHVVLQLQFELLQPFWKFVSSPILKETWGLEGRKQIIHPLQRKRRLEKGKMFCPCSLRKGLEESPKNFSPIRKER